MRPDVRSNRPRRLEVETPLLRGGVVVYRKRLPSCGARPWRRDLVKRLICTSLCIDNRWNGERCLYHHVVEGTTCEQLVLFCD